MLITIDSVEAVDQKINVKFSTDFGAAFGLWNSTSPKLGEQYDIELEIDEEFFWEWNAWVSLNTTCSLEVVNGSISAVVKLCSVEENGVAVVDFGGAIILIELDKYEGVLPGFIDLKVKGLTLFPTGL